MNMEESNAVCLCRLFVTIASEMNIKHHTTEVHQKQAFAAESKEQRERGATTKKKALFSLASQFLQIGYSSYLANDAC